MSHFNPLNDIIWDVDPLPYYFYPHLAELQMGRLSLNSEVKRAYI